MCWNWMESAVISLRSEIGAGCAARGSATFRVHRGQVLSGAQYCGRCGQPQIRSEVWLVYGGVKVDWRN